MYLRTIAVALSALVLLSGEAQARSFLDLFKTSAPQHEQSSRGGSISQDEALNLYSANQKKASFDACSELFPDARPLSVATVPATMKPLALCSDNFAVLYSQTSKTPLVVVERLNSGQMKDAKGEQRTNQFYPDPRIPVGGRSELSDYRSQHPAVDRGHQSPAADAPTPHAMAQTFALSNMVPQDPTNNRKIWSKVESDVRKFAARANGNVFVFTGPIFDSGHGTIGGNQVWVPTRLFKLVYDASSKRAWAYVLPNAEAPIEKPMDYEAFVKSTGLNLLGDLPVTGSVGRS